MLLLALPVPTDFVRVNREPAPSSFSTLEPLHSKRYIEFSDGFRTHSADPIPLPYARPSTPRHRSIYFHPPRNICIRGSGGRCTRTLEYGDEGGFLDFFTLFFPFRRSKIPFSINWPPSFQLTPTASMKNGTRETVRATMSAVGLGGSGRAGCRVKFFMVRSGFQPPPPRVCYLINIATAST